MRCKLVLILISVSIFTSFIFFGMACSGGDADTSAGAPDTVITSTQHTTVNSPQTTDSTLTPVSTEQKEYKAKYVCPNHCKGSGSEKEGICKVCEMELIENPLK